MAKRLSRDEKWDQAVIDLINKMFEIAGHNVTYDDIKDRKDDWYTQDRKSTRLNSSHT